MQTLGPLLPLHYMLFRIRDTGLCEFIRSYHDDSPLVYGGVKEATKQLIDQAALRAVRNVTVRNSGSSSTLINEHYSRLCSCFSG